MFLQVVFCYCSYIWAAQLTEGDIPFGCPLQLLVQGYQGHLCFLVSILFLHAVAQLVEALRYKLEGRGFDSQWRHWIFSLT